MSYEHDTTETIKTIDLRNTALSIADEQFEGPVQLEIGDGTLLVHKVSDLPRTEGGRPVLGKSVIGDPTVKYVVSTVNRAADTNSSDELKGIRPNTSENPNRYPPFAIGRAENIFRQRFPEIADDGKISNKHCTISAYTDSDGRTHLVIKDNSTNGTRVSWQEPRVNIWDGLRGYDPRGESSEEDGSKANRVEEILSRFSESDKEALEAFALAAYCKRDAQLNNNGQESLEQSQEMGKSLRKMSEEASRVAGQFARLKYGWGKVAF